MNGGTLTFDVESWSPTPAWVLGETMWSEDLDLGDAEADIGQWLANIGSGAATGAATGAAAGPWGALVGGLVGGGLGAIQTAMAPSQPRPGAPAAQAPAPAPTAPAAPAPRPAPAPSAPASPPRAVAVPVRQGAMTPTTTARGSGDTGGALTAQLGQLVPVLAALVGQLGQAMQARPAASEEFGSGEDTDEGRLVPSEVEAVPPAGAWLAAEARGESIGDDEQGGAAWTN